MVCRHVEFFQVFEVRLRRDVVYHGHLAWFMSHCLVSQIEVDGGVDELDVDPVVFRIVCPS